MSRAWYMDSSDADQRQEHQRSPPLSVSLEELKAKSGVLVFKIDLDTFEREGSFYEGLRKERGYNYEDRFADILLQWTPLIGATCGHYNWLL